eukprot:jgi/Botrbrau1/22562/Bobra.0678s0001.1
MTVTYTNGQSFAHGTSSDMRNETVTLAPTEVITGAWGRRGTSIDQIAFNTSFGRTLGPFGGNGGGPWELADLRVNGFFGHTWGNHDYNCIAGIGFYTSGGSPPSSKMSQLYPVGGSFMFEDGAEPYGNLPRMP